jgi:hypothetical protein
MSLYNDLLSQLSPWSRLKMRCYSVYITLMVYCRPRRSKVLALRLARQKSR